MKPGLFQDKLQAPIPDATTYYVPMGSFMIKNKLAAKPNEQILSPGVQTCVLVVLDSPHGVAVAHFDTPFVVAQTITEMLTEMQRMGEGAITARIYGGDYGMPMRGSSSISNAIYAELKKK